MFIKHHQTAIPSKKIAHAGSEKSKTLERFIKNDRFASGC